MILLAIDPGANGAYAIRYPDGTTTATRFTSESDFLEAMFTLASLAAQEQITVTAYIEQVGGYVGKAQPGSAMFNFGRNFGYILGICQALAFTVNLIRPQTWQKSYPTRTTKTQNATQHKRELKDHATRLFPTLKPTLATADSLLILHHATKQQ
jgi:hypothetical protein